MICLVVAARVGVSEMDNDFLRTFGDSPSANTGNTDILKFTLSIHNSCQLRHSIAISRYDIVLPPPYTHKWLLICLLGTRLCAQHTQYHMHSIHSTTCTCGGSHDAILCHCLDEDGDGRGYGLEGLECLNSASHQTVLTL